MLLGSALQINANQANGIGNDLTVLDGRRRKDSRHLTQDGSIIEQIEGARGRVIARRESSGSNEFSLWIENRDAPVRVVRQADAVASERTQ